MIEAEENPYKSILVSMLNNIDNFSYDEVKNIDKYPTSISIEVLKILIGNACKGQNIAGIELSRNKIKEIRTEWLIQFFLKAAKSCIDFTDDWEFSRLIELVHEVVPELEDDILNIGKDSNNYEILEFITNYMA